jgi:hypothetical protein
MFDVHVTVHCVTFLMIKPTRCTNFSNIFLEWNSICFGLFLCPSSEFFTVHTAVVYVIKICWQLASRIRMELSSILILLASCQQTSNETSHVSDSSSVHYKEFFTVHIAMIYVIQVCWQLASRIRMELPSWSCSQAVNKTVWHIPLLCVQWKTSDNGQRNCPKYVEFHSKNKFEKLVHLVGFIVRDMCICLWLVRWMNRKTVICARGV